jgi:hypothetical protein
MPTVVNATFKPIWQTILGKSIWHPICNSERLLIAKVVPGLAASKTLRMAEILSTVAAGSPVLPLEPEVFGDGAASRKRNPPRGRAGEAGEKSDRPMAPRRWPNKRLERRGHGGKGPQEENMEDARLPWTLAPREPFGTRGAKGARHRASGLGEGRERQAHGPVSRRKAVRFRGRPFFLKSARRGSPDGPVSGAPPGSKPRLRRWRRRCGLAAIGAPDDPKGR